MAIYGLAVTLAIQMAIASATASGRLPLERPLLGTATTTGSRRQAIIADVHRMDNSILRIFYAAAHVMDWK